MLASFHKWDIPRSFFVSVRLLLTCACTYNSWHYAGLNISHIHITTCRSYLMSEYCFTLLSLMSRISIWCITLKILTGQKTKKHGQLRYGNLLNNRKWHSLPLFHLKPPEKGQHADNFSLKENILLDTFGAFVKNYLSNIPQIHRR